MAELKEYGVIEEEDLTLHGHRQPSWSVRKERTVFVLTIEN
jgi:hypothetical protein